MIAGMSFPRPFGRYVLEERIALGGMAEIFRARTRAEGFSKRICIKRILPSFLDSTDFVTMFRDEASLAARLTHANVVQVFDFGEEDNSLYLAMEFVDGADLRTLMKEARLRSTFFSIEQACQVAIEMCRGLQYAHTLQIDSVPLQIVHRDISPHNVLVSRAGEIKITDFGIAKAAARATHTGTGVIKGKLAYMAPEQVRAGQLDHRVDLFATGIVLWEMLTGTRLYQADDEVTLLQRVVACDIPAPSTLRDEVPPALDDIVLQSLAREPQARFDNMRVFEKALSRFLLSFTQDPDALDLRNLVRHFLPSDKPTRKTAVMPLAPALQPDALAGTTSPDLEQNPAPRTASIFTDGAQTPDDATDADGLSASHRRADSTFPERAFGQAETAPRLTDETTASGRLAGAESAQEITADTRTWSSSPPATALPETTPDMVPADNATNAIESRADRHKSRLALGAASLLVGAGLGVGWQLNDARPQLFHDAVPGEIAASGARRTSASVPVTENLRVGEIPVPTTKAGPPPVEQSAEGLKAAPVMRDTAKKTATNANMPETATRPESISGKTWSPHERTPENNRPPMERKAAQARSSTGKAWIEMRKGWAHVYLGSKKLCETPCYLTLPTGTHTLFFDSSYEGRFSRKVRIRPEQTLRLELGGATKPEPE